MKWNSVTWTCMRLSVYLHNDTRPSIRPHILTMPLPMSLRGAITLKLPQTHAYTSLYLYTPACTQTSRNRDIYKYVSEEQRLAYKNCIFDKSRNAYGSSGTWRKLVLHLLCSSPLSWSQNLCCHAWERGFSQHCTFILHLTLTSWSWWFLKSILI